jgi:hypothetical protein
MTYQAVRRYFEEPVETVLTGFGIPIRYENQLEPASGADLEFALVRLNFGTTAEIAVGCAVEDLRASLVIEVYSEKGVGPGRLQTIAADLSSTLYTLNNRPKARDANGVLGRVDPITGPSFTPLSNEPYFVLSLSCGVVASIKNP